MIETQDLTVFYEENKAINNVTLSLNSPSITGIIGPNGAGKSTFMKALLGLVAHEGKIIFNGQSLPNLIGKIAYVEQKSAIDYSFPITVKACVALGTYKRVGLFKRLSQKEWKQVDEVLEKVGLLEFKNRPIKALSGGQFQRMLVARCLIQDLDYIFLDEPFVGIDSVSESIIVTTLKQLRDEGKMILIVHHDLSKVTTYFDHLMIMNKKLLAYGEVDDVFVPTYLKQAYGDNIFMGGDTSHVL